MVTELVQDRLGRFRARLRRAPTVMNAARSARLLMRRRWRRGIGRRGYRMGPYRPSTIAKKKREGKPTSPPNYIDTGHTISNIGIRKGHGSPGQQAAEIYPRTEQARKRIGYGMVSKWDAYGLTGETVASVYREWRQQLRRAIPDDQRREKVTIAMHL